VPPVDVVNAGILRLIQARFTGGVVVSTVGALEASPEVIGIVLQAPLNCGGRLVFTDGKVVATLARFRPTTVLLAPADALHLRDVNSLAAIGGRVRVSAVLGEIEGGLVDHLAALFQRKIRFTIETLPTTDDD
jgi:hypothetical protein